MNFETPKIIHRSDWGAVEPPSNKPYFLQIPTSIIIHHFGFPADKPNCRISEHFKGAKTIRKQKKNAIKKNGLIDIEYHYIIAPDGTIYKGRPVTAVGKHCDGKCNMSSVGIIAEYNPFHNGHLYHLNKIKELYPNDTIILVINGNFTERGTPSLIDKWKKVEIAKKAGIDLIIELPYPFATQSADYFSSGRTD